MAAHNTEPLYLPLYHKTLTAKHMGRNNMVFKNETTDTTEDAAELARRGYPNGSIVIAEHQTQGRSESRGSDSYKNLQFTVMVDQPIDLPTLWIVSTLAVVKACRTLRVDARSKWPNEVWAAGKRLGGTKISTNSSNTGPQYFVSIGLNVNQESFPEATHTASLRTFLKQDVPREVVLAYIMNSFESLLESSVDKVLKIYEKYDLLGEKLISVVPRNEDLKQFLATAIKVTKEGLVVKTQDSQAEIILSAPDVTVRLEDVTRKDKTSGLLAHRTLRQLITGTWGNERGVLYLVANNDGTLAGKYHLNNDIQGHWYDDGNKSVLLTFGFCTEKGIITWTGTMSRTTADITVDVTSVLASGKDIQTDNEVFKKQEDAEKLLGQVAKLKMPAPKAKPFNTK